MNQRRHLTVIAAVATLMAAAPLSSPLHAVDLGVRRR